MVRKLAARGLLCLICAMDWSAAEGVEPLDEGARRGTESVTVEVFYATNRLREADEPSADSYGGERGVPQYGRCRVDFAPIPGLNLVSGKLPFYVPSETSDVGLAIQTDPETFWSQLSQTVDGTRSGALVVFVHGYNYGFSRTCRMAAEFQRDLGDGAAVVMLSWPADGLPTHYVRDQADVEWSVPFLAAFLDRAGEKIGRDRVQVLAHSLGSRGVIQALERLRSDRGGEQVIGRLVLLAPDYDAQTFVELLPRLLPMTGAITLYASANDTPLKVSRQLSGYPRLGEGGGLLTVVEGIETIDVSQVGLYQILGHEYFFYHPFVAADLVDLLVTGRGAAQRSGLEATRKDGRVYWQIRERD